MAETKEKPSAKKVENKVSMTKAQAIYDEAKKEMARRHYVNYVEYVHEGRWKKAKHLEYICNIVQEFIEGKMNEKILIIQMPPQHGKAIQDDVPVLTTKGFKRHGDLMVGDLVYNQEGEQVKVLAIQQSYLHDCMKLTLDTKESFICAKEHEWVVEANRDKRVGGKRCRQTEIAESQHIFDGYHAKSPAIKVTKPLHNDDSELVIEPYLLGLWLGDGSSSDVSITSHVGDYEEVVQLLESKGHIVKVGDDSSNNKLIRVGTTNGKKGSNKFRNGIKYYGLFLNKHIPETYLNSSHYQRLELLKGLMDTDGCVNKNGTICEYCGINERLVRDVYKLVRSLGIKCSFLTGNATLNGRVISKKYRVQFTPCRGQEIFALRRKQERINNKSKQDRNDKFLFFIKSVEECGQHSVKCITVEGGIYLIGEGLVPTHNSQSITETLPSWYLGKFQTHRVICASYGDDLATRFGRRNKEKIERFGKKLFGIEINKKVSAATEFELSNNVGGMISRGIMAGITGQPSELIIVDDPVKNRQEADLPSYQDRVWEEWLNSLKTRLSADGKVIIIMTRWHERDLAGRVIEEEKGNALVINLPCEAEENDPLGRNIGDALFPEIGKGKAWMEKYKLSYQTAEGTRAWTALFQGRPSSQEGNMLKRHWWRYWKPKGSTLPAVTVKLPNGELQNIDAIDLPDDMEMTLQSWDMTFKDTAGTDFVAGGVWGNRGSSIFYLDQVYERMDFVNTIKALTSLTEKWPQATMKLIEDKANGPAVISMLKMTINGLIAIQPKGSKQARASAVSPLMEAGNVFLPHPMVHTWTNLFVEQCAAFPNGKNDDLVDQCSQALQRFIHTIVPEEEKIDNREFPEERFDDYDDDMESFFD